MQQSLFVIAGELQSAVMPWQQECDAGPDRQANAGIAAQKTTIASKPSPYLLPMCIVYESLTNSIPPSRCSPQ